MKRSFHLSFQLLDNIEYPKSV